MARFRINNPKMVMKNATHTMFSIAAKRLDLLVMSTPTIGRNRNVATMYGALQAIQKYVMNLVGGEIANDGVPIGQLCVSITEAAPT